MAKEVEIKFLVDDVGLLRSKLRSVRFREVTPRTHEMNTLYDTPERFLRLRRE
jgi:inorganic triphosphatase YgiF